VLSKTLLPRIDFGLVLVMEELQLLSFRLFYFELSDFGSQTVNLSLQQELSAAKPSI
jgi:hypothetical protein